MSGGTAALEVETGRWRGVSREGRVYRNCRSEEVENVQDEVVKMYCLGRGEGEVDNDNEGEGGVAECGG